MQASAARAFAVLPLARPPERNIAELRASVHALHRTSGRDTFGMADFANSERSTEESGAGRHLHPWNERRLVEKDEEACR